MGETLSGTLAFFFTVPRSHLAPGSTAGRFFILGCSAQRFAFNYAQDSRITHD